MKIMETVSMLQGIAYIRGVLTQWVDDDADVIDADGEEFGDVPISYKDYKRLFFGAGK